MTKIFVKGLTPEKAAACMEEYLMGRLPSEGSIIVKGPFMFLLEKEDKKDGGLVLPVKDGPAEEIHSLVETPFKALSAYREFIDGRRLPVGTAVIAGPDGIWIVPDGDIALSSDLPKFQYPFHALEKVLTAQEAAKKYSVDVKRVQTDCEERGKGLLEKKEARKSGNVWLLTLAAADRLYGKGHEEAEEINPLLLVYSTVEAAELWGRDSSDVRSAASGAGHRAARMWDGDRRKSGRTWLVTRQAMERVFGPARSGTLLKVARDL